MKKKYEEIVSQEETEVKEKEKVEEVAEEEAEEKDESEAVSELADKFMKILSSKMSAVESKIEDAKKCALYSKEDVKSMDAKTRSMEFIKAMLMHDRVKLQALSEGTAANGGFLVPEEWASVIVENILDITTIRPRATVVNVSTDSFHLPNLATRPKVYWRSELAVKSTSTATFGEITLTPYSLAAIITLSQELANDASVGLPGGIVNYVARLLAQAIALAEDEAFTTGNGTGRPTGIDNYTATIRAVSAANALTGDHLISCFYGLPAGYRNSSVWIMNSRTLSAVRGLKDTQNRYLLADLSNGQPPQVLGRPVIENNFMPSARIYFGDVSYYWIAVNGGLNVKVSDEAVVASQSAFERNLVHVRVEERVDGELTLTDA